MLEIKRQVWRIQFNRDFGSKSEGDRLVGRLEDIKSRAIPLLNKIGEIFPNTRSMIYLTLSVF